MVATQRRDKMELLFPIFRAWFRTYGLNDSIKRFRCVLPEYLILEMVEKVTENPEGNNPDPDNDEYEID